MFIYSNLYNALVYPASSSVILPFFKFPFCSLSGLFLSLSVFCIFSTYYTSGSQTEGCLENHLVGLFKMPILSSFQRLIIMDRGQDQKSAF